MSEVSPKEHLFSLLLVFLDGYPVGVWCIFSDETCTDEHSVLPARRVDDIDGQAVESFTVPVEFIKYVNLLEVLLHTRAETWEHSSSTSQSDIGD
mgnify:CR=1 FL=1